jgi:uncharacterized protein YbcI
MEGCWMGRQAKLEVRIAAVVAAFGRDQLGAALELVSVALQPDMLFITLRNVTCPAEKNLAEEDRGRALLGTLYSRAFDSVKHAIEARLEELLGRPVTGAAITVDPESGHGIMAFRLIGRPDNQAAEA